MVAAMKELKPVTPQPGKPLYLTVKDAVRDAITAGIFSPGEQMPSTKELSEQLSVSLVTAHRALQELVAAGVLQRSQGKGTFVHQRYLDREKTLSDTRVGLIFHREASLADFYHSQVLEGVRQAAQQLSVDLILLRYGEDVRNECNGYLFVNPLPSEVDHICGESRRNQPILTVGAKSDDKRISSIDVDNIDLARDAVNHLASLGHRHIAYVGGGDQVSNSRDRWLGFKAACESRGLSPREGHIISGDGWRLDERERNALIRTLTGPQRPTAVFAAGYYFALDVYGAAGTVGLRVPEDLSVVGVDDPPSASHLSPALTTMRQPLVQLGHAAVTALFERIQNDNAPLQNRTLRAELVIRRSSAAAPLR
jgi:GntR family transcriptional regulator, arabinose operon transcriptional repressor